LIYRKTLYGNYPVKRVIPHKEENKIIVTLFFENDNCLDFSKKTRYSSSFVINLNKLPKNIKRIDFYYKQKFCKKTKIAEYILKGENNDYC